MHSLTFLIKSYLRKVELEIRRLHGRALGVCRVLLDGLADVGEILLNHLRKQKIGVATHSGNVPEIRGVNLLVLDGIVLQSRSLKFKKRGAPSRPDGNSRVGALHELLAPATVQNFPREFALLSIGRVCLCDFCHGLQVKLVFSSLAISRQRGCIYTI